ncbi:peptidyl-prolyl cis-trans isomerase [Candidatus Woesearchaeota archaeon]|nr:peptidyl-prolyl cis-trans isomerase [Candidatus Woesearchaeota archaeon]
MTIKILAGVAILAIALVLFFILKSDEAKPLTVTIETSMGNIEVELNETAAPITVANFLSYVDEGFYDGLIFHRVIDGFMIQGGGITPDGKQKTTKAPIVLESGNGLKNDRGTIAMARTSDPNSATSQFFINTVDNDFLNKGARDDGYAVFGKVVRGMDVVDKIEKVPTMANPQDWPVDEVTIISIKRK